MKGKQCIFRIAAAMLLLPLLGSCDDPEPAAAGESSVPEGMVEIRPLLAGPYRTIPRSASEVRSAATRAYDDNAVTDGKLVKTERLPEGSTVWLIANSGNVYVKRSFAVYNPEDNADMSYLIPCVVNDAGEVVNLEGTPLYLEEGSEYLFYAISPARKLDEEAFKSGRVEFQVKNGEAFYANDCRYTHTTPVPIEIKSDDRAEAVQVVPLQPMINQTAQLKFEISRGDGVHNLDIQPSGIQVSGLQNDSPNPANSYGNTDGLYWHMSQSPEDEPIVLQHGDKGNIYHCYDYTVNSEGYVEIEMPVLPMRSISKPVIVVFRLKVNGVPSSYEMMLNEKDFKAGYSYGYRGKVSINNGVDVITWQYVSWEYDLDFPFD